MLVKKYLVNDLHFISSTGYRSPHLDEGGRFFELRIAELASAVTGWICRVGPQRLWRWELLRADFALQFRVHV